MGNAALGYAAPANQYRPPIHPLWHQLALSLTPTDDQQTLLFTAAGGISAQIRNIYAASHANPAHCAKELQLLTFDVVTLFHDAWMESHEVTKRLIFSPNTAPPPTELLSIEDEITEGHDQDEVCQGKPPPRQITARNPTVTRHTTRLGHTTPSIAHFTPLPLCTKSADRFRAPKQKPIHKITQRLRQILVFDVPFQQAHTHPSIAVLCAGCQTNQAARCLGSTPLCVPCG